MFVSSTSSWLLYIQLYLMVCVTLARSTLRDFAQFTFTLRLESYSIKCCIQRVILWVRMLFVLVFGCGHHVGGSGKRVSNINENNVRYEILPENLHA